MDLKQKTVSGFIWSFVDQFANTGITFVVGIILARLLTPREFGLTGMIVIFIAISNVFIDGGFSNALIRKTNCTKRDYSTVFIFNLIVGICLYFLLFISAPFIATFFQEPDLVAITRVLGIVLIIDSLTIIQRTLLTKRIDFKLQTRISLIASVVSGVIAVSLAFRGFGVWSLVYQRIIMRALNSLLLWYWNRWKPQLLFDMTSFKELFGFGSKLLVSGLIHMLYENIYLLVIGKFFTTADLGFYTRADKFKNLPSHNLNGVVSRVSYPVLSSMQNDVERLRLNYRKLVRGTMLINCVLMVGMAAVAEPMVIALVGEKWQQSIIYLQLLCFVAVFYPLHALNLNMLQVLGRSDLFLRLEVIKKIIAIPVILIGIYYGITWMIVGMIVDTVIAFFINSYWSRQFIGYSSRQQLTDILPSFLISFLLGGLVYFFNILTDFSAIITLILQFVLGGLFVVLLAELIRFTDYFMLKKLVHYYFKNLKK